MSEEVKAVAKKLRAELTDWIEARTPELLQMLGGPIPELPIVEDFRLLICITDGADADSCDYYPAVTSGTTHHRQLGLVEESRGYLGSFAGHHEGDD